MKQLGAGAKFSRRVDEIEDAEALRFHPNPCRSTRSAQTIEMKVIEDRRFCAKAEICLGRRGSGVQIAPPRPIESMRCKASQIDHLSKQHVVTSENPHQGRMQRFSCGFSSSISTTFGKIYFAAVRHSSDFK